MKDLIPAQDQVFALLKSSGALRNGHFELTNGIHTDVYLQVPLAMRDSHMAKVLSVGLSRMLRSEPEIRASAHELSIIAPTVSGLPVAYGVSEAMRSKQVYWAEKEGTLPMRFRPYLQQQRGEKVILVDDVFRSGARLKELMAICKKNGAEVMAIAVIAYLPSPDTPMIMDCPIFYLAKVHAQFYPDADTCPLCEKGIPLERPWI
jgi:orotate phosphoribosyltransferase